jgi:outer membrane biogenesis lipoprotein LolB
MYHGLTRLRDAALSRIFMPGGAPKAHASRQSNAQHQKKASTINGWQAYIPCRIKSENMKTLKLSVGLLGLLVVGILSGCSGMTAKSPDVSDSIRTSLDQVELKDVSIPYFWRADCEGILITLPADYLSSGFLRERADYLGTKAP